MEYKQLSQKFRDLFFELNSLKNQRGADSIVLAFNAMQSASDDYCIQITREKFNCGTGSEILFIKANREMITTKNGNRFFRVKSYSYTTAIVEEMGDEKIKLRHNDGRTFLYNYKTVLEIGCWRKEFKFS